MYEPLLPPEPELCGFLTVEGLQVDGQPAGLAVAFPTFPTHVRSVAGVRSHVTRQLDGLSEESLTILTLVHLP